MLHELIERAREQIVAHCERKLAELHPERPTLEVAGLLEEFLEEVRRALVADVRAGETSPLPGRSEASARLGELRFQHGDEPMDLVNYYGIACDSICEVAAREGATLAPRELQLLNRCVDSATAEAIRQYWIRTRDAAHRQKLEEFGGSVHEMRNALSSAVMGFELIAMGRAPVRGKTSELVARNLGHIKELLAESLVAVQLRSSSRRLRPERVRLGPFLHELVEAMPGQRGVTVSVEVDQSLELEIDPQLIGSALTNLVQNGIKFSREGGQVVLRGHEREGKVLIDIEDECGGLPATKLEELFQPFVQASSDRSGVGLGLSIARQSVEAHGGSIRAQSTARGCVFTVELPAADSARPIPPFRG
jgi:signal transduction histidine kinase